MKIVPIFPQRLYAIQYPNSPSHCLDELFDSWQDPEYLENFFVAHEDNLQSQFFGTISVDEAVLSTIESAEKFERKLMSMAAADGMTLDNLFIKLDKSSYKASGPFVASKAYGPGHKSWLRIYGLKVEDGIYIITGGVIKLTAKMSEFPPAGKQLERINKAKAWLKEEGIVDHDGIIEITLD
jgi:hypothetical protein